MGHLRLNHVFAHGHRQGGCVGVAHALGRAEAADDVVAGHVAVVDRGALGALQVRVRRILVGDCRYMESDQYMLVEAAKRSLHWLHLYMKEPVVSLLVAFSYSIRHTLVGKPSCAPTTPWQFLLWYRLAHA
jgi:hypothetical protein